MCTGSSDTAARCLGGQAMTLGCRPQALAFTSAPEKFMKYVLQRSLFYG